MRKHRICHLLLALVLAMLMAFAPAANVAQAASGPESQPPVQAGEEGSAPEEEEPAPQPEPDVTPEPENTPEPEQEGGAVSCPRGRRRHAHPPGGSGRGDPAQRGR